MRVNKVKKIKESEEVIEGEEVKTYWDIRKILIGGAVLAALLIFGSYFLIPRGNEEGVQVEDTLGVSSVRDEVPPLPDKETVDTIISNAQETISNLTTENLTSSQAAIQQVIADLQKLQENDGPGEVFCDLVCKR